MQIDGKKVQDGNILEKWDMSGMYKHTTGSAIGSHALKLIAGGVGGGKNYWLVKNSWNEEWGDGGTFKIKAGTNECGIEADIAGVSF